MRALSIGCALLGLVALAGTASAATFTFNTCGTAEGAACTFGVTGSHRTGGSGDPSNTWTFFNRNPGQPDDKTVTVDLRGYRTNDASQGGNWGMDTVARSRVNVFDGGLGIDSISPPGGNEVSPDHSIDNHGPRTSCGTPPCPFTAGPDEFVVFRLPFDNMDNIKFRLGYVDTDADVSVWLGGQGVGTGSDAFMMLAGGGFEWNQGATFEAAGYQKQTFLDVPAGSGFTSLTPSLAGRYLVIAAQHECTTNAGGACISDHGEDNFKLMSVKANTAAAPPPPLQASQPGALGLLGAGILTAAVMMRRFGRAAR